MKRLQGRRIIVSGGASGIGQATVRLFVAEGARVAVLDRAEAPAPPDGFAAVVDITDPASVTTTVTAAAGALGGLDGLVNAAGIFSAAGLADTSPLLFAQTLAVNLTGTFLTVQAAAPLMRQAGGGTIVNIGSGVGITPTGPGSTAYVASKGGVIAMSKALAMELAPAIRVNTVCPGAVETPMTRSFLRQSDGGVDPAIAGRYALRRVGAAEEIAAAILFLTSNEAAFVTGVTLPVDGGRTFH